MYTDIEKRRACQRASFKRRQRASKLACFNLLGNKCVRCGNDDKRVLNVDHVNGGGTQHRRKLGGNYFKKFAEEIRAGGRAYQLLCCNCNRIKRVERNEN